MALDFSEQTFANIEARMLDRVTDSIDKRDLSIVRVSIGPCAWYIEGIYMDLSSIQTNSFATTAVGEWLDLKVAERGLSRNQATAAVRQGVFNVAVPLNARFRTVDGDNSIIFFVSGASTIGDDGLYYAQVTAETAGTTGNSYTGTVIPITAISGLTLARITTIILAGTDEEDDESLRNRYILSLSEQSFAGNIAAYRNSILEESTVGAVQVYPASLYKGGGSVLCSILDANFNLATPALIEAIQYKICPPEADDDTPSANGYGLAPIGAVVDIVTGEELVINISANIQIAAGFNLAGVQPEIEAALENYLLTIRRAWGTPVSNTSVEYAVIVYLSRVNVTILGVEGIINVSNTTINNGTEDIAGEETSTIQQVPVLGTVTLNVID